MQARYPVEAAVGSRRAQQTDQCGVLIVEDYPGIREALTEILEEEGYPVMACANGRQALRYLRAFEKPALILLDLMMPEMSGWELAAELRRDPEFASIPIVLLSGIESVHEEAPVLQVDGFLRKPVDPEVLLQVVEMYCG